MNLRPEETVSAARLRHKLISRAVAAFSQALKLAQSGAWEVGARELEKAVAIDPGFSEAHGNLGVHYFKMGRLEQAAHELRCAIDLDPATSLDHSNLAVVMLLLHRSEEAGTEAQTAIGLGQRQFQSALRAWSSVDSPWGKRAKKARNTSSMPPGSCLRLTWELAQLFRDEGDDRRATLELDRYKQATAPPLKK